MLYIKVISQLKHFRQKFVFDFELCKPFLHYSKMSAGSVAWSLSVICTSVYISSGLNANIKLPMYAVLNLCVHFNKTKG